MGKGKIRQRIEEKRKKRKSANPSETLANAAERLGVNLRKAKTHKGRLHLERFEPHIIEEPRKLVLLRSSSCKPEVKQLLTDITKIRRPYSLMLHRKREGLDPFSDHEPLEYLCRKNLCALFCFGHSNTKRPARLVAGRVYEDTLLDMYELHVTDYTSLSNFASKVQSALGSKPLVLAQGSAFEQSEEMKFLRNYLVDLFSFGSPRSIDVKGIDTVITITALTPDEAQQSAAKAEWQRNPFVMFRRYRIDQSSSGNTLEEIGPRFTLQLERHRLPTKDIWKQAIRVPKQLKEKKVKNVTKTALGETMGRVHTGVQDFMKLHTPHHHKTKKDSISAQDAVKS